MSMLEGGRNPKRRKRVRVSGFMARSKAAKKAGTGSHMLKTRRAKGRKKLVPVANR